MILLYMSTAIGGFVVFRRRFPETTGRSLTAIDRSFTFWAAQVRQSRFTHYAVGTLGSLSGVLTGYNLAITAVTLVLVNDDWNLNGFEQGLLASTVVGGGAAGASVAGLLSDRFGRRYLLMSMAALFVASGSVRRSPRRWAGYCRPHCCRYRHGVSGPTAGIYVAEVAPATIRGRLLSIQLVATTLGVILAYCVGLALVNQHEGWRLMFGFIALPAAIYGLGLLPLMDLRVGWSPWVSPTRRAGPCSDFPATGRSVNWQRSPPSARVPPRVTAVLEAAPRGRAPRMAGGVGRTRCRVRVRVLRGETWCYSMRQRFWRRSASRIRPCHSRLLVGLGVVSLATNLIALAVVDRTGRKPLMITGLFVLAASLLVMAALTTAPAHHGCGALGPGRMPRGFRCGFLVDRGADLSGIVLSEMFPGSIRGRATSLSSTMNGVFAIAFTLTFPMLLDGRDWP